MNFITDGNDDSAYIGCMTTVDAWEEADTEPYSDDDSGDDSIPDLLGDSNSDEDMPDLQGLEEEVPENSNSHSHFYSELPLTPESYIDEESVLPTACTSCPFTDNPSEALWVEEGKDVLQQGLAVPAPLSLEDIDIPIDILREALCGIDGVDMVDVPMMDDTSKDTNIPIYSVGFIGGMRTQIMWDTGSVVSAINTTHLRSLGKPMEDEFDPKEIRAANKTKMTVVGRAIVDLDFENC